MEKKFLNEAAKMQRLANIISEEEYEKIISENQIEQVELTFVKAAEDTGNLIYKGTDGKYYTEVEGVLHDMTAAGEPDTPVHHVYIKQGEPVYNPEDRFARNIGSKVQTETRLDYFDDLPLGKPSTLPDEAKANLKSWLNVYEEGGVFELYEKWEYPSRDYEGEFIDTENDYLAKISRHSSLDEIKAFWRKIGEVAEANPDFASFNFESTSCGVFEEYKTYQELTDAVGRCFYR